MKIEKRDGRLSRKILIGMVVDKSVLSRIAGKWEEKGLFKSKWENLVAGWCVSFFNRYERAPRKAIEGIFESWANSDVVDEAVVRLVERFLDGLSGEYAARKKEINADYLVDQAAEYFTAIKAERLSTEIKAEVSSGRIEHAVKRIEGFNKVEIGIGAGVNVLEDAEPMRRAFEHRGEPLIRLPGAYGEFFGDALERDGFIAIYAPEKRGKTTLLMDLSWYAMEQRRKVAFFGCGDLSEGQMMVRWAIRATERPWRAGKYRYPTSIHRDEDSDIATVNFKLRHAEEPLSWQEAVRSMNDIRKHVTKSTRTPLLKMSIHPTDSISIRGIAGILDTWERNEGWTPDVVAIDYADILAGPLSGNADGREQINATWKAMRQLSQVRHCLVLTATQTDAASMDAYLITTSHFSEDKRKAAHVTGIVGLNQTPEEKEQQIIRLNWANLRENDFSVSRCVHLAGCFAIANPAIRSTW